MFSDRMYLKEPFKRTRITKRRKNAMDKDFLRRELLRLEKERERNVRIHCLRVAARIQREIERIYVEIAMLEKSET